MEEILKTACRGEPITAKPPTLTSPLNQGYLKPRPPHLPHTCETKWEVLISLLLFYLFFFYLYFSNQRSYGNDQWGTDVRECV